MVFADTVAISAKLSLPVLLSIIKPDSLFELSFQFKVKLVGEFISIV